MANYSTGRPPRRERERGLHGGVTRIFWRHSIWEVLASIWWIVTMIASVVVAIVWYLEGDLAMKEYLYGIFK